MSDYITKHLNTQICHLFTLVRCTGGESTCGGDVIIFMLWQVILNLFYQGKASGKGSRGWGGGGLWEEATGSPQSWGGGIQWGEVEMGATKRRSREHIFLKVQGCSACWGLCVRRTNVTGELSNTKKISPLTIWSERPLTCVTSTWLWGVTSIEGRWSLFATIRRRRRRFAVLLCPMYIHSSFRSIAILEIFLQPGRNDALYCVCHSTDEAWLLLIKPRGGERKESIRV